MEPSRDIARLIEIMSALRTPGSGCPWDLEQDFSSIAPYTIEEAYEVADAIERGELDDLRDELGDLLLQVVYHARMAEELGRFSFGDVVEAITRKMIRRHPHVFGDEEARGAGMAKGMWERIKESERKGKDAKERVRHLDGIPVGLPALTRALKLQTRAARVGFDWGAIAPVLDKIEEEFRELRLALSGGAPKADVEEELGDTLFAIVNACRHLGVEPERALARTNAKFSFRFGHIEDALAALGRRLEDATLEEMEALWEEAKGK
jgi:ATP diphosphatase